MGNRVVSQAIPKVDYKALVTGKAVYTDDLAAKDSLVVKVLRSPHAHALIQDINLTRAELVPDIGSESPFCRRCSCDRCRTDKRSGK